MKRAAAILVVLAPLAGQRITTLPFTDRQSIKQVWYEDLSGDGHRDLIVAVTTRGQDYGRSLHIHYARPDQGGFNQAPDLVAPVPASVSAAAIGDVHPDPGAEVIWFAARGAYVWRPRARPDQREVKLVTCEFLFQHPHQKMLYSWQVGVRDLDGDGRVDLLLPEPGGFQVAMQRRDANGKVSFQAATLRIPPAPPQPQGSDAGRGSEGRREFRLDMQFGAIDDGEGTIRIDEGPLLSVTEQLAAPQVQDWNGDGRLDVFAKQRERVFVWQQRADGSFPSTPDRNLQFPLTDQQTRLDPRFHAALVEFTGDRRTDAVLVAKDRHADTLRSQVMFFPQRDDPAPLFAKGVPGQLLVLAGFASKPAFADIDGDGSVDLHINTWRLDVMNQLTAGKDQSLDIEIYVFLNRRGRFSRRPDLTHRATLKGEVLRSGGDRLSARFLGDASGDGIRDLLVRDRPERVRMMMVRRRQDGLTILPRPIWEMRISPQARLQYPTGDLPRPAFLVLEQTQVLLVRF